MFSAAKFVVAGVIVALFGGFLLIAQPFDQQRDVPGATTSAGPGAFSPTGSLAQPRAGHTATLLLDGRVLVVGGLDDRDDGTLASAEVWDPATASFSPAGSLAQLRDGHTATLLRDGRVLIVGGSGGGFVYPASAEVWDPDSETFGPTGSPAKWRDEHIATLLPDGRVLVFGGEPISAEVWDPATRTFSPAGSHGKRREVPAPAAMRGPAATALRDGRILIVEGCGIFCDSRLGPAEVWDPATDASSPAGSSALSDIDSATLLADGRVLLVGPEDRDWERISAEVWDPETASFSPAGSLVEARRGHLAMGLPDGRALIVGGCIDGYCHGPLDPLASAKIWDPGTETFGPAGSTAEAGMGTATLLADGRVLVVGLGEAGTSAEVWEPGDR